MKKYIPFLYLVVFSLIYTACSTSQTNVNMDEVSTIVALTSTMESSISGNTSIPIITETEQQISTTPTIKILPTHTPSFTPTPTSLTPTPDCGNKMEFVSETIPDGSSFNPGEKFEKVWKFKNTGTCIWSNAYSLEFIDGERMGFTELKPFSTPVLPGEIGTVSVLLTSPDAPGLYRGNWKLSDGSGTIFGLGNDGTKPFWTEITVVDAGTGLDLGTPDWIDTFSKDKGTFYLGEDGGIDFEIEDGKLIISTLEIIGDTWRVAERPSLSDFYIEATFISGADCSGKDSYGFIIRAPDSNSLYIDSGYVIGFSCDGSFRFYRIENGNYFGIQNWTVNLNLNNGPNQTNRLGILVQGENIDIYINGSLSGEYADSVFTNGLFGLMIRSDETSDFSVSVDQISTWNIP